LSNKECEWWCINRYISTREGEGGEKASEEGGVVKSGRLGKVNQAESSNQKKVLYGFLKEATKGVTEVRGWFEKL
jgi:hypothetical protein